MKLKKRIEEKAKKLNSGMFITDNIYNNAQLEHRKAKYWILWHNTYNVVASAKNQDELEMEIDYLLNDEGGF